jgi:hypothetical protein
MQEKVEKLEDGKPFYKRVNASNMVINSYLVMGLELYYGASRYDGATLAGLLNLDITRM